MAGVRHQGHLTGGQVREAGVRIYENTRMTGLSARGAGVEIQTPRARIRAERAVLATNAFASPLRGMRRSIVPIWSWVMVSEPLSGDQLGSLGWAGRHMVGVFDEGIELKMLRLTRDNRILFGGYHAYRFASGTKAEPLTPALLNARSSRP